MGRLLRLWGVAILAFAISAAAMAQEAFQAYAHHDYADAYKGFEKLASNGDLNAMNNLGLMLVNGQGTTVNYGAAADWFEKAANQGHLSAINNLGTLYELGHGRQQNYQMAAQYYRLAADRGMGDAQFNLAALYEQGHGVAKDPMQAYIWYGLAARSGDADAKAAQAKVKSDLSANILGSADAFIKSWQPTSK
ncbi:MAG TPA: tetratricopeptide repeat protein [Dongiaceae bacterium]|nr:tetratricopeptide repeat protein [Dongiaceae bacterium]